MLNKSEAPRRSWIGTGLVGMAILATAGALAGQSDPWVGVQKSVSGSKPLASFTIEGAAVTGVDLGTGRRLPDSEARTLSIKARLPDAYLRIADGPHFVARDGFLGAAPLFRMDFKGGARGSGAVNPEAYVPQQRAYLARVLLGLGVVRGPLSLSVEQAAPGVISVAGPAGFDTQVDVGADGVPTRVRYAGRSFFFTVKAGERMAERREEAAEYQITFSDRRRVEGYNVPFSILTTAVSRVDGKSTTFIEEIRLSRFTPNPTVTDNDFR